jgi:hypothetical protein
MRVIHGCGQKITMRMDLADVEDAADPMGRLLGLALSVKPVLYPFPEVRQFMPNLIAGDYWTML